MSICIFSAAHNQHQSSPVLNKPSAPRDPLYGLVPHNFTVNQVVKTNTECLLYSRGGIGGDMELREEERLAQQEIQAQMMLSTSISFAASLGINLRPGVATFGKGDCLIEACVDQFLRADFEDLMEQEREPQYWRLKVFDMVENNITAYNMYKITKPTRKGSKEKQWAQDWVQLRQAGQFQCQAGDLMAPGLATILHKNILVFNTHPQAATPITVHLATTLGGSTTTDVPILLCYDQKHYEGLLPLTSDDQTRTTEIVGSYFPKKATKPLNLVCPVPGRVRNLGKEDEGCSSLGSMPSTFNINKETKQVTKAKSNRKHILGSMPSNLYGTESSSYPSQLHLINHGKNLCFSNSIVHLLSQTDIKSFLINELPTQPDPTIETAQELARLYRNRMKVDSTEELRR